MPNVTIVPIKIFLQDAAVGRIRRGPALRQCAAAQFAALLIALLPLAAVPARADWVGEAIDLMGTRVSVELWAEDENRGRELVAEVLSEYRRIDREMSTYKAASEISLVNARAAEGAVVVGEELFALIARALEFSVASRGAFDITYESVGYLYDFRAHQRPDSRRIAANLAAIDYRHVTLDRAQQTIRFAQPGVRINLGGIAKGYAVEHGAMLLRQQGVQHALLNAGGDTRVLGDRRGQPWIVGIRHPRLGDDVLTRLPIVDEAISTSGDYERFFEEGGRRYHHILNPATGLPTEGILSVTIIGPDATTTDGLLTTVFVLGAEAGLKMLEESFPGYEAVIVDSAGKLSYSSGLTAPANE
jgi:thiamine biosynthesis lipoprotein